MHLYSDQVNTSHDIINSFANYFSSVYENYDYVVNVNLKHQIPPTVLSSSLHSCTIDLI